MATHDYVIDNSTGANVRADLNLVLQAVLTNNSNSSSPSTTAAYMLWVDTTANIVKIRNSANNAWINLFTTAGGVDVDAASNFNEDVTFTGASANVVWDKSDNALEFADNAKAIFGTGNDLEIYHDGSNSRIHSPSHSLFIRTGNVAGFFNGDGAEDILKGTVNGAVELYHDNSKKFQTDAAGVIIYGNLYQVDNDKLMLGNLSDLQIYHDGSDSYINDAGTGSLKLVSNAFKVMNAANNEAMIYANQDGAVELYFDNSKKAYTYTNGFALTANLS